MKKRNLFIGFCIALLSFICVGLASPAQKTAYADGGSFTITFNAGDGTCETTSSTTNESGKLDTIPTATSNYPRFAFVGWKIENSDTFISTDTVFSDNTTVVASYEVKNNNYTLSPLTESQIKITATAGTNGEYFKTTTSLNEALSYIQNDLYADKNTLTINFETSGTDSIELASNIELSFSSKITTINLGGTLNLNSYQIKFTPTASTTTLNLNNLTLNSKSNQDQFIIAGDNSKTVVVNVTSCSFTSESQNKNYAIKFEHGGNKNITFSSTTHSTSYLYNHEEGIASTVSKIISGSTLNITAPYTLDNNKIISTKITNTNAFNILPVNDSYSCSFSIANSGIYLQTSINMVFDENGGTFINSNLSNQSVRYNTSTQLEFPTSQELSLEHKTLNGFIGVITFDEATKSAHSLASTTWYFDQTKLEAFFSDTSETDIYAKIASNFSANTFETTNCFTYYKYNTSDLNFKAVNLMLELGVTPRFIANWSDTIYTVTFHENGGTDVSDLSGVFETQVTILSPTRTGYTFDGWYTSEDFEEASKVTTNTDGKYTITDNVNFYAKWSPQELTVTIISDGTTTPVTTYYDTLLSTILEEQNITKEGHSLLGWYTSNDFDESTLLNTETKQIQENMTIYAKWKINEYTITLYLNIDDVTPYQTFTANYESRTTALTDLRPEKTGYLFKGWFTNPNGQIRYDTSIPFPYIPQTMPAEDVTLYAFFEQESYTITYICNNTIYTRTHGMHYNDTITLPAPPTLTGFTFVNWYTESTFQNIFSLETMPNNSFDLYAKFNEKLSININKTTQTYTLSDNGKFEIDSGLSGFKIEYLVNNNWTTEQPTKKGTYDVKITRSEDGTYKAFSETIKGGLVITPNNLDLSAINLILYSIAGFEIIIAVILLFMTKQRKTYLNYAITLPFGIVSGSQFVNFVVALVLAIFGLVLVIMQFVKLRNVNIEIEKISTEEKEYTPPDVSENSTISKKVEIILEQNGFSSKYYSENKSTKNNITGEDDNINSDEDGNNSIY